MKAGILCPISALPSSYGVGDFGKNAYTFVDQLKKSDVKIWQILPLNPLAYGNSPYQPYSSYAGDELYIDLEDLVKDGCLGNSLYSSCHSVHGFPSFVNLKVRNNA